MKNWSSIEVRELRWRLGWSQAELARQIGCLQQLINEWEAGGARPTEAQTKILGRLEGESDIYTSRIQREAVADAFLEEQNSSQITHTEVANRLEKSY